MRKLFLSEEQKKAGWYERSYIPHYDSTDLIQHVTFRLYDSLPSVCLRGWESELVAIDALDAHGAHPRHSPRRTDESRKFADHRRALIEEYLDRGAGEKWLQDPRVASEVATSLLHFNQIRYSLHAWVIMPNHVHVLISPIGGVKLSQIMHSWKGHTGRVANRILGRSGAFWQREYFDRFIRDKHHFFACTKYIEDNPVKAGLCKKAADWQFSSAGYRRLG